MKTITENDLYKNFDSVVKEVVDQGDAMLITRPENKNVVLLSEKEYRSWQETNYLLATEANRKSLQKGMTAAHSDKKLTPEEWDKLVQEDE